MKRVKGFIIQTVTYTLLMASFLLVSGSLALSTWAYLIQGKWIWFI